jgi:hypothetical protein
MTALARVTLEAPEAPSLTAKNWIRLPQIDDAKARAHG